MAPEVEGSSPSVHPKDFIRAGFIRPGFLFGNDVFQPCDSIFFYMDLHICFPQFFGPGKFSRLSMVEVFNAIKKSSELTGKGQKFPFIRYNIKEQSGCSKIYNRFLLEEKKP